MMELTADCRRCFGLCCVAPAFAASADFAIDKPAGRSCPNLQADFGCGIHAELRPRGFPGCTTYDCFGAGQQVAQVTYGGRDWRSHSETAAEMFAVFGVMRDLHELLWLVVEAIGLAADRDLRDHLDESRQQVEELARRPVVELLGLDREAVRVRVNRLLQQTSEAVRRDVQGRADLRGEDLVGADLRGRSLRGANLRGARLVGAELRAVDLRLADLTGADLRGADLRGSDLSTAIFVTQSQLHSAKGDRSTRVPTGRRPPGHWVFEERAR